MSTIQEDIAKAKEILRDEAAEGVSSAALDYLFNLIESVAGASRPKRYLMIMSQTGTDAPVVTRDIDNTIGDIVWTYLGVPGYFTGTLAGAFPEGTTFGAASIGQKKGAGGMTLVEITRLDDDSVLMVTSELLAATGNAGSSIAPTAANGILAVQAVEISVGQR